MKINEIKLYKLYTKGRYYEGKDFKVIEDKIISSDIEDGGADHEVIIQDLSTSKYYQGSYCDWDVDCNFEYDEETGEVFRCDFDNNLDEVVPKEITTIIYERIK